MASTRRTLQVVGVLVGSAFAEVSVLTDSVDFDAITGYAPSSDVKYETLVDMDVAAVGDGVFLGKQDLAVAKTTVLIPIGSIINQGRGDETPEGKVTAEVAVDSETIPITYTSKCRTNLNECFKNGVEYEVSPLDNQATITTKVTLTADAINPTMVDRTNVGKIFQESLVRYAVLSVSRPPSDGAVASGTAVTQGSVTGKTLTDLAADTTAAASVADVLVEYDNVGFADANCLADGSGQGCFSSSSKLEKDGAEWGDVTVTNKPFVWQNGLSALEDMQKYYKDLSLFWAYWGADQFQADIATVAVSPDENGLETDLSIFTEQVVSKTLAYSVMWLNVVGKMEEAVKLCSNAPPAISPATGKDFKNAMVAWDQAVAYYSGSKEGANPLGTGEGKLLFHRAQSYCGSFQESCIQGSGGNPDEARVNTAIINQFTLGLESLKGDQTGRAPCMELLRTKSTIVTHMHIPFVQSAIRYANKLGEKSDPPTANDIQDYNKWMAQRGEFRSFYRVFEPYVYACDTEAHDAIIKEYEKNKDWTLTTVVDNSNVWVKVDTATITTNFEKVYACLGIDDLDISVKDFTDYTPSGEWS